MQKNKKQRCCASMTNNHKKKHDDARHLTDPQRTHQMVNKSLISPDPGGQCSHSIPRSLKCEKQTKNNVVPSWKNKQKNDDVSHLTDPQLTQQIVKTNL
jgi:hypothetical protein